MRLSLVTGAIALLCVGVALGADTVRATGVYSNLYFNKEGGIYLSKPSRKPYFLLKERMQRVIDDEKSEQQPDAKIDDRIRDSIVKAGSRLRASLADDASRACGIRAAF